MGGETEKEEEKTFDFAAAKKVNPVFIWQYSENFVFVCVLRGCVSKYK